MRTIVLNKSNIVNLDNNSSFVYRFPSSVKFENDYIALSQIQLYYSWYNVSSQLNNNKFSYTWLIGSTLTTFEIVIPDGLYEFETLNEYLQFEMIKNGTFLQNESQDNVYYIEIILNASRYSVQINTYNFPTALPTNYTTPSNFVGFPTSTFNPQIIIKSKFNEILGFDLITTDLNQNNSYVVPANQNLIQKLNTTISYISTIAPNIQPNNNLLLSLSNIDNVYASPTSILYSIGTNGAQFGGLINETPTTYAFAKLIPGTYNEIRVNLYGPNLQPIKILDPNITMIFVLKNINDLY